jgi:hypothetical protein
MDQAEAFRQLGQFPHCDHLILHIPGECEYCDAHPAWQALRLIWGINFSGENNPAKAPCPSSLIRPIEQAHNWPNNRPRAADEPARSVYEHMRDNIKNG